MLKSLDQGSVADQVPEPRGPCRHTHQATLASSWLHNIAMWLARSSQRRALEELARLNNRYLEDIGISKAEALREAARPFWRQ